MSRTDAERRARLKYQKAKVKRLEIAFYPKDYDLYEYVCGKERRMEYVRDLIRNDMESENRKE